MPELSGRELLREWRKVMDALVGSAASVSGRTEIPHQLLEAMQRQLELVQQVIEREQTLQKQVAGHLLAPVDAVFDLLEQSGIMMRRQAEALEAAGRALEETAALVKTQAQLMEKTIGALRTPAEQVRAVAGLDQRTPKRGGRQSARGRST